MTRFLVTLALMTYFTVVPASQLQDRHQHMDARGAKAMGFDQSATTHHFYLYEDGGAIQVTVKDPADATNLAAIQTHLPHIAQMFSAGDFSAPHFVHDEKVPGTEAMAKFRDRIGFVYQKMKTGGQVRIKTSHINARAAVHEFLRYQIIEHKTGDSLEVTSLHD